MKELEARLREMVPHYLGRSWRPSDGVPLKVLAGVKKRLNGRLPASVRMLYANLGGVPELLAAHHRLRLPGALQFEDGYLVFMDENQDVVSWGIRSADIGEPDPTVWQRNNTSPPEWFSEDKSVVELMASMFDWYVEIGLLSVP